jgi:hypothetical protein
VVGKVEGAADQILDDQDMKAGKRRFLTHCPSSEHLAQLAA